MKLHPAARSSALYTKDPLLIPSAALLALTILQYRADNLPHWAGGRVSISFAVGSGY
ncbi:hypothetical protein Vi05172_g9347 [Venturia inaequalis]|nr:hypothetical protein Vi05172_g9347 [Venturia inaequalis]